MDFDLSAATQVLSRTPSALSAFLGGLSDGWLKANEGPKTFSPFDVVGHLIDGETSNWMPRARLILSGQAEQPFEPFDRFAHWDRNVGRDMAALLDEFAGLRAANLVELASWNLTDEQLAMAGTHPQLGATSLQQVLATWVVHDLGHIAQIARVMAKQYVDPIGPWALFLPIVTDRPVPAT